MAKSIVNLFNKKGIFLTFIAISIIALFITVFTPSDIGLRKDTGVVKTRVSNINEYILDLENVYLERTLQFTGIRAINALLKYMESQNKFLSNFEDSFKEVLLDGKIDGQPIDNFIDPDIMTGNTYRNWISRTVTVADDAFNLKSNITVNDIKIYQSRPWFLTVNANISLLVSSETAAWEKIILVTNEISIEKFEDPYYTINTGGFYKNKINKTTVQFGDWDLSKVKDHIKYGTYTHYDEGKAPSFIMRFTNTSLNSSCCGIESFVNPNKLDAVNKDQMESYADYLFFNHSLKNKCTELYNVTSVWPDYIPLKLDFEHLAIYNLTSYDFVGAC